MFKCYMDIYNDRFKSLQLKFLEVVFPSAQKSSLVGYERQRNLLGEGRGWGCWKNERNKNIL